MRPRRFYPKLPWRPAARSKDRASILGSSGEGDAGHYYEAHVAGISIRIAAAPDTSLDEAKIVAIAKLALAGLKERVALEAARA